jgi:oligopeptide/dipeptide ABC transporter ATP-binding protein
MTDLLDIEHLRLSIADKLIIADVSLSVGTGQALGVVGESGSGKSMTMRSVLRALPRRATVEGAISYRGRAVYEMSARELRAWRAKQVALIYQDPRAHINPVHTIGDFLTEVLRRTEGRRAAEERAVDLLQQVGIPDAERRMDQYPHQLSGGLLQRVMIASAMLVRPELIIADEPTTALDVTTQQEVMAILDEQRRERDLAMIFITHDLDLAVAVTDRLAVMYAGRIVESGASATIHEAARHPYTAALMAARPSTTTRRRPWTIPGRPAAAYEIETGCGFAPRCPFAQDRCRLETPALTAHAGHQVACHRANELDLTELARA